MLERITVRVSEDKIDQLDSLVERDEYANRSQAIRAALGEFLESPQTRRVVTDGGLPDSIIEFSKEDRDRLACRSCGDLVDREWLADRLCPGCRLRDDRDGASATVASVDRGDGLETDGGFSGGGYAPSQLDQSLGSLLEQWVNRDQPADRCRFCNEQLAEDQQPQDRFCDESCEDGFDAVLQARLEIGQRDLEQRGYD